MPEHTLPRSGNAPLIFTGTLLAEASSRGHNANRWHELALYRTDGGRWVAHVAYRTQWQGETDADDVEALADPVALRDWLRGHNPAQHVQGFPPGDTYREKQARLGEDLTRRYRAAVSAILAAAPELAERIE